MMACVVRINLWEACAEGNLEVVKILTETGADVNKKNEDGVTPLFLAVKSRRLDLVKYLVKNKANVNDFTIVEIREFNNTVNIFVKNVADVNYAGGVGEMSCLQHAIADSSLAIVKYLVKNGADANYINCVLGSPLHIAVKRGSLEIVKYLVQHGADVNYNHEWKGSALHAAAEYGYLVIAKYLVEHGADMNCEDQEKGTPLHVAVKCSSLEIVKCLVEHGADVNYENQKKGTALHVAVKHSSLAIVECLIKHGADVNYEKGWRGSVLYVAVQRESSAIVKCLVEHGADVNYEHRSEGSVLYVALKRYSLEIVIYLVEHGADVNYENKWEGTTLQVAVEHGFLKIVKFLVEHGADVNYENESKGTALHAAAEHGSLDIVIYLIECGAVMYKNQEKGTALHVAAERGSIEIVRCLVERGADIDGKDGKDGKYGTPLHVAVDSNRLEVAKHLIEHGADGKDEDKHFEYSLICLACEESDESFVDYLLRSEIVKNVDKRSGYESSPLSIACSKGDTEIVRTLLKYNVDVRKEWKLECRNDEIVNILELELKKSVKHREKIQNLRSMNEEEKLTKVKLPLKYFASNASLSLGGSNATVVYVGIMDDESEVAVKRMLTQSCSETAENERNILSLTDTKKSSFIVNYRHFFHDDTFMYLIVDLCEETLREHVHSQSIEYLQQHGPRMIKQILTGLEFLHELGILHRDLKPSNVLVDVDGRMRLADFGISRVLNEDETTDYTHPKGTTGWMAAEVIEAIKQKVAGRYKKKSDVQVVGMIAYFILTQGKHPYGDPLDRMGNIVKGKPVYLKKLDDRNGRQFVKWLISHKLNDRPYAHEALRFSFLDGIVAEAIEGPLQRPRIIKI